MKVGGDMAGLVSQGRSLIERARRQPCWLVRSSWKTLALEASRSEVGAESQIGGPAHKKATRSTISDCSTYFSGILTSHEKGSKNSSNSNCAIN